LSRKAVRLLLSTSWGEAIKLARDLDAENRQRQKMQGSMRREANKLLPEIKESVIILIKDGWHPGLIGLLASYVREKYFRPALIFSPQGDIARGSARSIPKFSIFNALQACEDLLLSFGGHKMAAGMMIPIKNIALLKSRLNELAEETLSPEDLVPIYSIDARVSLKEFNKKFVKAVVGAKEGGERFEAIAFSLSEEGKRIMRSGDIDMIFTPTINRWKGRETLQLEIKDVRGGNSNGVSRENQEHPGLS